ncbi:hypothetical protein [Bradyrhizobium australafricanum]|uniref:hypothetical protein n=1 Tax=Bradyrhizobium australafricanum TaxID=2821406 RepID=UPI001CE34E80|nr:hypothetical protein [Bradyrhizobium australafricanum]MCA6099610.1 hypothetical protein [Bradyrhizobium australafricanum]
MISAQTLRVCREGKPLRTFPDDALGNLDASADMRACDSRAVYEPFMIAPYAAAGFRPEALRRAPSSVLTRWRRLFQEPIGLPQKSKKVATAAQTVSYWSAAYVSLCNGVTVFAVTGGVLGFLLVAKHYL